MTPALVLLLAWPAAAGEFRDALRRAEARDARDEERVEYATRAIRAWAPGDGRLMLSHAHLRRAEALLARRDPAGAAADLDKVVELDPGNLKALLPRGRARLEAGRAAAAAADFSAYAAAFPDDPEGWLGLARARVPDSGGGAPAAARKAAARAARLAPADWRAPWLEGRARARAGDVRAALELLGRAVGLSKGASEPRRERAGVLRGLGRHAEAEADWTAALPPLERRLEEARRLPAPAAVLAADTNALAEAFHERGDLRAFLLKGDEAAADFREACALGREDSCARARRPRPRRPDGDAGERVYAN